MVKHEPTVTALTKKGVRELQENNLLRGRSVEDAQRLWRQHDKLDAHEELTRGRCPSRPGSDDYGLPLMEGDESDDPVPLDMLLR